MQRPSLKKMLVLAMASAIEMKGFENNDLQIITPAGLISGILSKYEEGKEPDVKNMIPEFANTATKAYREAMGDDEKLSENDGYLVLNKAELTTGQGFTYKLGDLIIFFDQIIGVTIGKKTISE